MASMETIPNILIVEDDVGHAELIRRAFDDSDREYALEIAVNVTEAREYLEQTTPTLIVADLMLPDGRGTDLIVQDGADDEFAVVVMTSHGDETMAVEAMKSGALDYVVKSDETFRSMPHVADRAIREWRQRRELRRTRNELLRMSQVYLDAADPIVMTDRYAKITDINRAARELYGWSEEELLGEPIARLVPEHDEKRARQMYARCLEGKEVRNVEITNETRRGDELSVLLTLSRLTDRSGEVLGVAAIAKDITERKRLQAEVRQAQKMEAIGTLTSGVAHDFNNLLMGINGCTDIALGQMSEEHPSRDYVEEIKEAVTRGAGLTRQLLAFSRKRGSEPTVFRLDDVICEVEQLLKPLLDDRVDLQVETNSGGARLECDPGHIEQVVLNLVVNARDAVGTNGEIAIRTDRVERDDWSVDAGALEPGEHLMVEVSDDGDGMDEETQEHIFEPFFTTKPVGEGTGLGLSTVYGIVQQCGGAISVESEPGEGTSFRVFFEMTDRDVQDGGDEDSDVRIGAGERILLVEDEDRVRIAVEQYLENGKYEPVSAEDAKVALELIESGADFDLAIVDVALPTESGREVVDEIHERRPEMPVLFMSAYATDRLVREGLIHSGAHILQKPFSERTLLQRVGGLLEESAQEGLGREDAAQHAGQPLGVLLVEDNEIARMATRELLEEEGFRAFEAETGGRARQVLSRESDAIDLILLDVTLPDAEGPDLAGDFRSASHDMPIIFLSGGAPDDPAVEFALQQPGTAYLQKPVDFETLMTTIREMTDVRSAGD